MSDADLRAAERRWLADRSAPAKLALARARLRAGLLTPAALEAAALLGDPEARQLAGTVDLGHLLDDHPPDRWRGAARLLPRGNLALAFAATRGAPSPGWDEARAAVRLGAASALEARIVRAAEEVRDDDPGGYGHVESSPRLTLLRLARLASRHPGPAARRLAPPLRGGEPDPGPEGDLALALAHWATLLPGGTRRVGGNLEQLASDLLAGARVDVLPRTR